MISQSNLTVDTLEIAQTEIKNELLNKIGHEKSFTRIVIYPYGTGIGMRDKFVGVVQTYMNGKKVIYSYWDSFNNYQLEETYALKGSKWVQISWTNYNIDEQKISHHDYENDIYTYWYNDGKIKALKENNKTTYWYEDGSIKEEMGEVNNKPYHKFWDLNGNEISLVKSKTKNSAPLYKTIQGRINNLSVIGYFILLVATIGILIFKLQNVESPPY